MTTKAVAGMERPELMPGEAPVEFYDKSKEGWFWYHDPKPEPEKVPQPKKDMVITTEAGPKQYETRNPSLENYTIKEVWDMHPDEFQGLLNGIQKKAVQTPNEKNILEYLTLQDVARRKALAYTNASMFVNQKYSDRFNTNRDYPTAAPGVSAKVVAQRTEVSGTIAGAVNDHALLFFTAEGCSFCDKQAAILAYFADKYPMEIKRVDIHQNTAAAARFNITTTPTLLLIKNGTRQYMPVSVGVVAVSDLEKKVYKAIRYLAGDTDIDTFQTYDYQKGGAYDPQSILDEDQPWRTFENETSE